MTDYGYGMWALVALDLAVFILFAVSVYEQSEVGGRARSREPG